MRVDMVEAQAGLSIAMTHQLLLSAFQLRCCTEANCLVDDHIDLMTPPALLILITGPVLSNCNDFTLDLVRATFYLVDTELG